MQFNLVCKNLFWKKPELSLMHCSWKTYFRFSAGSAWKYLFYCPFTIWHQIKKYFQFLLYNANQNAELLSSLRNKWVPEKNYYTPSDDEASPPTEWKPQFSVPVNLQDRKYIGSHKYWESIALFISFFNPHEQLPLFYVRD